MRLLQTLLTIVAVFAALPALSHAPLQDSVPAEGSVGPAPASFVLNFAHPARVTSLQLKGPGVASRPIRGFSRAPATSHSVAAPKLEPGRYELSFRAAAEDGHVMSGKISFTVAASGSAATAPAPR